MGLPRALMAFGRPTGCCSAGTALLPACHFAVVKEGAGEPVVAVPLAAGKHLVAEHAELVRVVIVVLRSHGCTLRTPGWRGCERGRADVRERAAVRAGRGSIKHQAGRTTWPTPVGGGSRGGAGGGAYLRRCARLTGQPRCGGALWPSSPAGGAKGAGSGGGDARQNRPAARTRSREIIACDSTSAILARGAGARRWARR